MQLDGDDQNIYLLTYAMSETNCSSSCTPFEFVDML